MFLGQSKEDWVKAVGAAYGTLDPRGYESWQAGLRADQELQMRREREAQEGKIRGLELERAQRVNDASKTLNERYTVGMRDTAAIKAQDDDFEAALKASGEGKALPAFNPEVWNAPLFRKANQRELLDARRGLFAATGNAQGLQIADQEERGLNVQDRFKGLAQRVEQDPNAIVELSRRLNLDGNVPLTVETPMDPKTGRLTGVARINLVRSNGDTKPIEVRGRQLQQLMLATSYIEEGAPEDVEKGLQLLAGIDQELAARVAASNKLNMDIAQLHNSAFGTQEEVRQGNARLALAQSQEARQRDSEWQIIGATQDRRGLLYFNPRTRQTETRPLPAGVDADQLTRRLGLNGPGLTQQQQAEIRLQLIKAGITDPMEMSRAFSAVVGAEDPMMALAKQLAQMNQGAGKANNAAAAAEAARVRGMRDEEMGAYRAGLGASVDWYGAP